MSNTGGLESTTVSKRVKRIAVRAFSPLRSVLVITERGSLSLPATSVSFDEVGVKAFGMSCLPVEWVPRFFVVQSAAGNMPISSLDEYISACLSELGMAEEEVIVRSSGPKETIDQRGSLVSQVCSCREVGRTIHLLLERLDSSIHSTVHWVVQPHIRPIRKGHLSNERRLARERRDFVAEFEADSIRPGYTSKVAVRHWRDGDEVTASDLDCVSETAATLKLKRVAIWALALSSRVLFEWVWSGSRLWIVQADLAASGGGVNPRELRPAAIPSISPDCLHLFRVADAEDFRRYGKLRNAWLYGELGYQMPTFYILTDADAISEVLTGQVTALLDSDLGELTQRPLVIRTDGTDIPKQKREMLPRSDGLHTKLEATKWLTEDFQPKAVRNDLGACNLCLIAHHFIPSVAAAWARAEPNGYIVRIESLWGLPEGLYWYSHDTFEVDVRDISASKLPIRRRLRFKGTFVAPDADGHWVHNKPRPQYDWGSSVTFDQWLFEIARTTKEVANHDGHPVAVMWFVDNDSRATKHPVLPWYHAESTIGSPKAAPRRKLTMASDFTIETTANWISLQELVKGGRRVERVMLEPKDPELVRNPEFATDLARFAASNQIVIELAGGVLSHAYHILKREGAQVECIDLFGAEEEIVEYNKLVRDKIPDFIQRKGDTVEVVGLKGDALLTALKQKLVEESFEALDAKAGDDLIGELADVQEVITAICNALQIPWEQVEAERAEKNNRRGGFNRGVMLKRTATPHSLPAEQIDGGIPPLSEAERETSIERAADIPGNRPYRRPDRRNVDHQMEGVFTFETDLNRVGTEAHSTVFEIPIDHDDFRDFKLTVKVTRTRATLWSQIRLRLEPTQMPIRLEQLSLFPEERTTDADPPPREPLDSDPNVRLKGPS